MDDDPQRAALAAVLDLARDLLGARRAAVLLSAADGGLRSAARRGYVAPAAASLAAILAVGECAARLAAGETLAAPGDHAPAALAAWMDTTGDRGLLVLPLLDRGRARGVLALGFDRAPAAGHDAARRARSLASLAALALAGAAPVPTLNPPPSDDERERQRLRTLLETLPEGLIMVQRDQRVDFANQAAADILGYVPGDGFWDDPQRDDAPRTPDGRPYPREDLPLTRALGGETVRAAEMVLPRPDGGELPLLISAGPVHAAGGGVTGAITVFQDISRLKELDRLKDDFINTVSHELRTPTTTIRGGALTLLKRGDRLDEETRRQLLQDIAEESERLHHLVEDLLSLSRSQAGMRMTPEPMRLHRAVNKVIIDLGPRVGAHTLTVDVAADLPLVEADPVVLEQVLRNLIENAVQHSARGGRVEVDAEARDDEVVIGVLDRGPGIPAEDLDRVFEPFYRLPATVASGAQGAGLGLAVCRRLVEMQGGRIWAENRPGAGAAFRFTLPVAPYTEE